MASGWDTVSWVVAVHVGIVTLGDAYNLRIVIFIGVRLHVPDDLVGKELGELGCLKDVPLNVAQGIVSERLHNLRDEEERHIN